MALLRDETSLVSGQNEPHFGLELASFCGIYNGRELALGTAPTPPSATRTFVP